MFKKVSRMRAFACLLVLSVLFAAFAVAEDVAETAVPVEEVVEEVAATEEAYDPYDVPGITVEIGDGTYIPGMGEEEADPEVDFISGIKKIVQSTGFVNGEWRQYAMMAVACVLLYLAIVKGFEPLLLLPIAFGALLTNLPLGGLMDAPVYKIFVDAQEAARYAAYYDKSVSVVLNSAGETVYQVLYKNGGLLHYLYQGVKLGIYPPLIFMGVGAMTDFAPLLANPKSLLLGAAAQLGIFLAFFLAKFIGFTAAEAGSIGIIGGADGPTAIFVTTKLAPHLLGPIAVAAYSYMALVPVIQPPIMKLLTTKKERTIRMSGLRTVSRTEMVIFPIMVTIIVSLLLPDAATLIGMLMLGNLMRVSGVVERISKTAQNELCNIVTIFLGLTVGATTKGDTFLTMDTIKIVLMGVIAFGGGTAGGVLLAKLMNVLSGGTINPLIGSAGVSAVPMAARVSQTVGQKEDPGNFLLMHAMGPNVAGVIGSAVAAGVFIALFAH